MFEDLGKKKASELLLKVGYFPFIAVGGITVTFYDVAQMEKHPVIVFTVLVVVLHAALLAFWAFVFRRLLAEASHLMSISKTAANIGLVCAYVAGLLVGWAVHSHS